MVFLGGAFLAQVSEMLDGIKLRSRNNAVGFFRTAVQLMCMEGLCQPVVTPPWPWGMVFGACREQELLKSAFGNTG